MLRGVIVAGPARQGVGTLVGWATGASSDPGPLLPAIYLPLARLCPVAELVRAACCWPVLPVPAGGALSIGLLPALLLAGVP